MEQLFVLHFETLREILVEMYTRLKTGFDDYQNKKFTEHFSQISHKFLRIN